MAKLKMARRNHFFRCESFGLTTSSGEPFGVSSLMARGEVIDVIFSLFVAVKVVDRSTAVAVGERTSGVVVEFMLSTEVTVDVGGICNDILGGVRGSIRYE